MFKDFSFALLEPWFRPLMDPFLYREGGVTDGKNWPSQENGDHILVERRNPLLWSAETISADVLVELRRTVV